jgi:hypothetical protein|tara:strand:+ start:78 stop:461 length:384 start_codon:yes stop_codon:yes gene_type:complete
MNQYEILSDFCDKNIHDKKEFVELLKNNDPGAQAYLAGFFGLWIQVFNETGQNSNITFEALGKSLGIGLNEIRTLYFEAFKIVDKEDFKDTEDYTTVVEAFAEGRAAYQAHHVLYVDAKFDWSKTPK